ncbi:hypothetical protein EJB05_20058, partial [Eragrostis curvula]
IVPAAAPQSAAAAAPPSRRLLPRGLQHPQGAYRPHNIRRDSSLCRPRKPPEFAADALLHQIRPVHIVQPPHSGSPCPAPSRPGQEIFSRITARSNHRATYTSISCRLAFQHKDSVCWKPKFENISTNNPMRPNDLSRDQETVPAEGSSCCITNVQATPEIEKKYVHRVYDAIAPHFSSTRFAKWPKVAGFLNSLRQGSIVLDAGCGNGKYLGFNPDCFFIGCDISPPLIEICAGKGHEVLVADAVNLPYRDNFGDAAISIAVLHHLSTVDRRRKAIEELVRVVRRGGLVLITVWAREQEDKSLLNKWTPLSEKYNEEWVDGSSPPGRSQSTTSLESIAENDEDTGVVKQTGDMLNKKCGGLEDKTLIDCSDSSISEIDRTQQEYFVPWHLPFHRAEIGGASAAAVENGFAKKDDKKGAVVYSRYYHVFVEGELQRLVAGINYAAIVDQFYDKSNWGSEGRSHLKLIIGVSGRQPQNPHRTATCEMLACGLLEVAVSEFAAESVLCLPAEFADCNVLGFLSEVPNASKASRKNFLFGTMPCLSILLSNFWTRSLLFTLV